MTATAYSAKLWVIAFILALVAAISGWAMFWSSNQQVANITAELATTKTQTQSARSEITKTRSTLASLSTEKTGLTTRITELGAETTKLKAHINTLTKQLTTTKHQATELRHQQAASEALKQKLTAELHHQQTASEALKQKLTAALGKQQAATADLKQQLENKLATVRNQLTTATASLQSLTAERDQTQREYAVLQRHLEKITNEQSALQQQYTAIETRLHKQRQEQDMLRQQAEITSQHNADLISERDHLMVVKAQLLRQLESSSAAVKNLQQQNQELKDTQNLAQELQSRVDQLRTERARFKASLEQVKARLKKTMDSSNIKITQMKNNTTAIRLGSDITFGLASAKLTKAGKTALDLIAKALNAFPSRLISVEGHTDPLPLTNPKIGRYPSNWELSAARAASAIRYLVSKKVDPKRLRVVGYSSYRPLTTRVEEYARDRRIVILLLPLTAEQISTKTIPVSP